jgi:thiamine biosynthesis protein ThiI
MTQVILIHHHEIALKGKNRSFFEKKLIENIKKATGLKKISKDFGRFIIEIEKKVQFNQLKQKLSIIFGIADFTLAYQVKKDFEEVKKAVIQLIKSRSFPSFRISARRGDKKFPLTSEAINKKLGRLVENQTGSRVNLNKPAFKIYVEIGQKNAYLYFKKHKGPGGLPASTAGKLLCLLSGGIDSAVAAYKMIKRGASVDFIHFHSYPKTDKASIEKAKQLVNLLNQFQFGAKIYLIPFLAFQKEVFEKCQHRFLILIYRRAMFKISQEIALKENYQGLVTGESLGQVASQTLENMAVVNQGINLPIYRPLAGDDKQEIINLAKEIKTYQISIRPHQDCCSLFAPKHPATKAKLEDIFKEEKKTTIKKLINQVIKKTERIEIGG